MQALAIVRKPSAALVDCLLTFREREPLQLAPALEEHRAYCEGLRWLGFEVQELAQKPDLPDACFVEDCAVVVDELAVLCRSPHANRRLEVPEVAGALGKLRPVGRLRDPATLEGGDVLCVGRDVFVGLSTRTNSAGVEALVELLQPHGYRVHPIPVAGALHLKTALGDLGQGRLLIRSDWLEWPAELETGAWELLEAPAEEPWGANFLRWGQRVLVPEAHPATAQLLTDKGLQVKLVPLTELSKAEAGLTCLSLLIG